MILFYILGI